MTVFLSVCKTRTNWGGWDLEFFFNILYPFFLAALAALYQSGTNKFEYSNIRILLIQIFIRIFVRIIFWIQIYSDIRLCQLFGYKYIRIFVRSNILIRIYSYIRSYKFSESDNVFV